MANEVFENDFLCFQDRHRMASRKIMGLTQGCWNQKIIKTPKRKVPLLIVSFPGKELAILNGEKKLSEISTKALKAVVENLKNGESPWHRRHEKRDD